MGSGLQKYTRRVQHRALYGAVYNRDHKATFALGWEQGARVGKLDALLETADCVSEAYHVHSVKRRSHAEDKNRHFHGSTHRSMVQYGESQRIRAIYGCTTTN